MSLQLHIDSPSINTGKCLELCANLIYTAPTASITLNDRGLKRDTLETGCMECHISGSGFQGPSHSGRCSSPDMPRCDKDIASRTNRRLYRKEVQSVICSILSYDSKVSRRSSTVFHFFSGPLLRHPSKPFFLFALLVP